MEQSAQQVRTKRDVERVEALVQVALDDDTAADQGSWRGYAASAALRGAGSMP